MNKNRAIKIKEISVCLAEVSNTGLDRIHEFAMAVKADKVVKTETPDGYLTYVFVYHENNE